MLKVIVTVGGWWYVLCNGLLKLSVKVCGTVSVTISLTGSVTLSVALDVTVN